MKITLKGTQEAIEKWFFIQVGLGAIEDFKIVSSNIRKDKDNHEIVIDTNDGLEGTKEINV